MKYAEKEDTGLLFFFFYFFPTQKFPRASLYDAEDSLVACKKVMRFCTWSFFYSLLRHFFT